jgi:S-adenosyl-L-methionine hydrolase (adenosine-forming)
VPVIALLTDFGLQDHYVGAMKGAILSDCPDAVLVDVCHDVPAYDVAAGALMLDAAYRHFPGGTVFLAVVDPGVGSERRPIAVGAGRWLFVGPDNGVFTFVLQAHPQARVCLLANPMLYRTPLSAVFHGRDLFGPTAAHLARGLPLDEVGPPLADPVRLVLPAPVRTADGWQGMVLHVDRFGNLLTNLTESELCSAGNRSALQVEIAGRVVPLVVSYSDVATGEACALIGSGGRLEIALHAGRADAVPGWARSSEVRIRPSD